MHNLVQASHSTKIDTTAIPTPWDLAAEVINPLQHQGRSSDTGGLLGLHTGWDFVFNNCLVGVEVSADRSTIGNKLKTVGHRQEILTSKTNMNWALTAGFRIGAIFNQSLCYVNLSWVGAQWQVNPGLDTRTVSDILFENPGYGADRKSKKSHFLNGIRPAVGFSTKINEQLYLSLEAGYTWFEPIHHRFNFVDLAYAGGLDETAPHLLKMKAKPEVFDTKIKFSWKLNSAA